MGDSGRGDTGWLNHHTALESQTLKERDKSGEAHSGGGLIGSRGAPQELSEAMFHPRPEGGVAVNQVEKGGGGEGPMPGR